MRRDLQRNVVPRPSVTGSAAVRRGRPFRALALLLLLFMLWLGWRWPVIGARVGEVAALLMPHPVPAVVREAAVGTISAPVHDAVPVRRADPAGFTPAPRPQPPEPAPRADVSMAMPAAPLPAAAPAQPTVATPVQFEDAAAFRLAQSAYDRLRAGQRRQAAALFDAALGLADNRQWQADRAALGRRWQIGGFALLRDGGSAGPAASPVLGGGQMGGSIAFLPDPYARRPLALVARANVAADRAGLRGDTAQAAIGIRQTLAPGVSISAERLIAIGSATRGDWTLRLAAGGVRGRMSVYGEAGVLGSGQAYGGAQASARLLRIGPATLNAAAWASLQTGTPDVWRVDVGPSISAQVKGIRLQADWRQRVAGNAAPGSGPAVTISAGF
ncbi:hypothetical protein [Sandarakinorhabdus sp.]|uniref:hypothetical protein n=1 Tax=Sandarakinorhabdus sp. TaxID=1916663 RepID=UPI00333EC7BA